MTTPFHHPRKRFGQHFLRDQYVIQRILQALDLQPGQHGVEIGPGLGALTLQALPLLTALDVIEIDRDVIPELMAKCRNKGDLRVHSADVLRYDFHQLTTKPASLRVFGNLPYNISTPLIFHLLQHIDLIKDMHFMLQREVAERLAAPPGGGDYGRLSIMVQYHCQVELLFTVSAQSFNPPPKVESAVVRLTPYRPLPTVANDPELLATLVKQAFSQRRKMIHNSLQEWLNMAQLTSLAIDPNARPEQLSVQDFVKMSNMVGQT
ncbi:MAG: 16S rRNA (adenine(1518)-N(6)/adenine(1519)-N(6))-dimethyltransferase RsmA [Gammaproteobacteria bacterium]